MKNTKEICLSIWNIRGPTTGSVGDATKAKFDFMQSPDGADPDLALYLESPCAERFPDAIKKDWGSSFWRSALAPASSGNDDEIQTPFPKGILLVNRNSKITIRPWKDPCPQCRTSFGFSIEYGKKEILRFLAIWLVAKTEKGYLDLFRKIMESYDLANFFHEKPKVPCIVAGDTNVNISGGTTMTSHDLKDDKWINNERKIRALAEICDLTPPLNLTRDPNGKCLSSSVQGDNTLFHTDGMYYRCDHVLISRGLGFEEKLQSGAMKIYLGQNGKSDGTAASDHMPIILHFPQT